MQTSFIKNFLDYRFDRTFAPIFTNGRFTLVNHTNVYADILGVKHLSNLKASTDFQMTGTNIRVNVDSVTGSYDGYNKKYISDQGLYDPIAALEELGRRTSERRNYKEDQVALATTYTNDDSHELFILNMLISWFMSYTYNTCGGKDDKFRVTSSGYSDSHVKIAYNGVLTERTEEIELMHPFDDDKPPGLAILRNRDNYWQRPYVLHYNASGRYQSEFYLAHTAGRVKKTTLNVDVDLPGIDSSQLLLDPVNSDGQFPYNIGSIPWAKTETLWQWIIEYVRMNRVEHAFAAALEVLGALAFQPMPSYQESVIWEKMRFNLVISAFSPTRARMRTNLEGEPYQTSNQAHEFTFTESPAPNQFLMSSAIANYYSWLGIYVLTDNYARERSDWHVVFGSTDAELAVLYSTYARAATISVVTGQEYASCMTESCYLAYDTSLMYDVNTITFDEVLEEGYPQSVTLTSVPPFISGSLVLGGCTAPTDAVAHLASVQHIKISDSHMLSPVEAIALGNVYRLFGYDTTFRNPRTKEILSVFASHRDSVVYAPTVLDATYSQDDFEVWGSVRRGGWSYQIPEAATLPRGTNITITVTKPHIEAVVWRDTRVQLKMSLQLAKPRKHLEFKVRAGTSYKTQLIKAAPSQVRAKVEEGFQAGREIAPPAKPTEASDTAATAEIVPEALAPVEGVE